MFDDPSPAEKRRRERFLEFALKNLAKDIRDDEWAWLYDPPQRRAA